ncbi:hypothetical protein FCK90_00380 [Kocuria coralli]|uniref:Uncharacterized protein n=1 Tax=Kocuria coralli TaxID=1461025 RepID=A0A5J5L2U2_9MICC|nr:hypothetical protein [Kocuria coralli]KAA9395525.1 hypothetical protein FCK90_00380 [Kocuria coralli]
MTVPRSPVDLLRSLPVGTRVTVRWALPDDDASGKRFTDSIGTILDSSFAPSVNPGAGDGKESGPSGAGTGLPSPAERLPVETLVLQTRAGEVSIPWTVIRLAKPVPPPPPRRAPRVRRS